MILMLGDSWRRQGPSSLPAWVSNTEDQTKTLVELARQGREQDFRDLAAMLGIDQERRDALWSGTVARLKP